jgi:hypothetical protein
VAVLAGRRWPPVRTGLALRAPRPGTLHRDADRPVACQVGCHLATIRVKGAPQAPRPYGTASGGP